MAGIVLVFIGLCPLRFSVYTCVLGGGTRPRSDGQLLGPNHGRGPSPLETAGRGHVRRASTSKRPPPYQPLRHSRCEATESSERESPGLFCLASSSESSRRLCVSVTWTAMERAPASPAHRSAPVARCMPRALSSARCSARSSSSPASFTSSCQSTWCTCWKRSARRPK